MLQVSIVVRCVLNIYISDALNYDISIEQRCISNLLNLRKLLCYPKFLPRRVFDFQKDSVTDRISSKANTKKKKKKRRKDRERTNHILPTVSQ